MSTCTTALVRLTSLALRLGPSHISQPGTGSPPLASTPRGSSGGATSIGSWYDLDPTQLLQVAWQLVADHKGMSEISNFCVTSLEYLTGDPE